jgi:hydroxymethylbilane synthase
MSAPVPKSAVRRIVIASRESALAMWQARHVESCIRTLDAAMEVEIRGMTTEGDRLVAASLAQLGGQGLLVKELEDALEPGGADVGVHTM